jgi:hypothetical protein
MLLAGSFKEYPLVLLLEIFLHRRETGLLEVSSPKESGYFYVKNGEIKDGEVGSVRGAAAVELAGSFVDASFQFKPLKPTDYAHIVWEKSFGPNRLADTPHTRVKAFRTALEQLRPYPEAAYGMLKRAVVSSARRALRLLLLYTPAAYHRLRKTGGSVAWRTLAYSAAIRRRAVLPTPRQVAQSNISFGLIVVALVVVGAVSISKILRMDQDGVKIVEPSDKDIGSQSQTPPRQVPRARSKRKARIGRQIMRVNKRGVSLLKEPMALPEGALVHNFENATSDSDTLKQEPATTSDMQTISVVVQVKNGRVSQASLLKHRPGMECYEAAALRIARKRRYAKAEKYTEIVEVKVRPPKQ